MSCDTNMEDFGSGRWWFRKIQFSEWGKFKGKISRDFITLSGRSLIGLTVCKCPSFELIKLETEKCTSWPRKGLNRHSPLGISNFLGVLVVWVYIICPYQGHFIFSPQIRPVCTLDGKPSHLHVFFSDPMKLYNWWKEMERSIAKWPKKQIGKMSWFTRSYIQDNRRSVLSEKKLHTELCETQSIGNIINTPWIHIERAKEQIRDWERERQNNNCRDKVFFFFLIWNTLDFCY